MVSGAVGIGQGRTGAQDASLKKTSRRPRLETLRQVIFARAGIVSSVADSLKVDPRTVRRWRDGDPRVKEMFVESREAVLDLAEAELVKGLKAGVPSDRYFILKCLGKSRGYVERQEITGKDGGTIGLSVEDKLLRRLSNDELRQLSEIMEKAADRLRVEEGKGPAVAPRVH